MPTPRQRLETLQTEVRKAKRLNGISKDQLQHFRSRRGQRTVVASTSLIQGTNVRITTRNPRRSADRIMPRFTMSDSQVVRDQGSPDNKNRFSRTVSPRPDGLKESLLGHKRTSPGPEQRQVHC